MKRGGHKFIASVWHTCSMKARRRGYRVIHDHALRFAGALS